MDKDSLIDEADVPAVERVRKEVLESLEGVGKMSVTKTLDSYVLVFELTGRFVYWRRWVSPIVRSCKTLSDVSVCFFDDAAASKTFGVARPEGCLALKLELLRSKARTVGAKPPEHKFSRPKKVEFVRQAVAAVRSQKRQMPASWVADAPVLSAFVEAVYCDAAKVYVDSIRLATDPNEPHKIALEGPFESLSQSMLEFAFFGHEEHVKEITCDLGRNEETRRIEATLCGPKVSPLVFRNDYKT